MALKIYVPRLSEASWSALLLIDFFFISWTIQPVNSNLHYLQIRCHWRFNIYFVSLILGAFQG